MAMTCICKINLENTKNETQTIDLGDVSDNLWKILKFQQKRQSI